LAAGERARERCAHSSNALLQLLCTGLVTSISGSAI
jgi:hypothetical protein